MCLQVENREPPPATEIMAATALTMLNQKFSAAYPSVDSLGGFQPTVQAGGTVRKWDELPRDGGVERTSSAFPI